MESHKVTDASEFVLRTVAIISWVGCSVPNRATNSAEGIGKAVLNTGLWTKKLEKSRQQ